mgnify:FL=1
MSIVSWFWLYVQIASAAYRDPLISAEDVETLSSKNLIERFESPASVSVLTAERIRDAGITSIAEALRLMPGLIVREQVNGQFDVSIRGGENSPRSEFLSEHNSRSVLLMIDDRPVFDYFQGGIYWEALPIAIEDVKKIEVVRGAVASMYGPNAAMGVIHIKTKRPDHNEFRTQISTAIGNHGFQKAHLAISGRSDLFHWRLHGASEVRDRYESTYYNVTAGEYQPLEELGPSRGLSAYPNSERAQKLESLGLNIYNEPERLVSYDLSMYFQSSEVQKAYISSLNTPITTNVASSHALNLKVRAYDWTARVSQHEGKQKIIGFPELENDFKVTQSLLEYELKGAQWFVRPGLKYDEMRYESEFVQGARTLHNTALYARSEFQFTENLKLTASGSMDRYSFPKEKYLSYEIGMSKKLDPNSLVRMGMQQANRSSFMSNSFFDLDLAISGDPNNRFVFKGDKNVGLVRIKSYELGWREKLNFHNQLDLELFVNYSDHFSGFLIGPTETTGSQTVTYKRLEELPTRVEQVGLTADWKYFGYNWDLNAFVTVQETQVKDQIQGNAKPIVLEDEASKGSPNYYGGSSFNWRFLDAWKFNSTFYMMAESETNLIGLDQAYEQPLTGLLNVSLHHRFSPVINSTIGVKNISNTAHSQYFYTEAIKPTVFLQLRASF